MNVKNGLKMTAMQPFQSRSANRPMLVDFMYFTAEKFDILFPVYNIFVHNLPNLGQWRLAVAPVV